MNIKHNPLLILAFLPAFALSTAQADLPNNSFDYNKASTNYVNNSSSGGGASNGGGVSNSFYYGGTVGVSEGGSYCGGAVNCEDKDTAWKLFAGYNLTDMFAVEGAYVNLGDMHKGGLVPASSDVSAVTVNAVATLPISDQFDAFGKIGAARWSSDNSTSSESGLGITYGFGAKMKLNETTKLRAEWEKIPNVETAPGQDTDVNMMSFGVELSTY